LTPEGDSIPDDSWGPTIAELARAQSFQFHESTTEAGSDEEWDDQQDDGGQDAELWEAVEQTALADGFRSDFE
jgi:hypothetical protein